LAGKAHDLKKVSAPEEYYQVNFELTKKLYDAFLNSEASKFIFISSVKASADQVTYILKESDSPDPKTHYGKSKLMAEEYIQAQPLPEGKSYFILRPCMIHGPGNKGNLNLLYKLVSKGIPYPLAAFENKRSFLSIENLCFVIREIVERNNIPSGIYQVADDESLSTNELVKLIAAASERKPLLWNISPALIRSIAKLGNVFHLPLTTERLNKLTENYIVDTTKIKQALGKELPVRARDGIVKTIRSFQKNADAKLEH
jgi:nucleoside-diphosphate-sugar epimerase